MWNPTPRYPQAPRKSSKLRHPTVFNLTLLVGVSNLGCSIRALHSQRVNNGNASYETSNCDDGEVSDKPRAFSGSPDSSQLFSVRDVRCDASTLPRRSDAECL
jgi:hypothetical protein